MAVDDVYHLVINYTWLSQRCVNDFSFTRLSTTEPTLAEVTAIANDAKDLLRPTQHPSLTYTNWTARQVAGAGVSYITNPCKATGGKAFDGLYTTNTAGSGDSGSILPPQCAFVITLKTGFVGRRKRGRLYTAGHTENQQNSGIWDPTTILTPATTAWNTFMAKYGLPSGTDVNWRYGIFSFREASGCLATPGNPMHPHDTPNPGAAFTPVNSYQLRATVYTQRRRTLGVGR